MRNHLRKVKNTLRKSVKLFEPTNVWPPYPHVSLTTWRSPKNVPNFGDDLSTVIVSLLLAQSGRTLDDEAKQSKELLAIGSVIHLAKKDAVVWGSGVNGKVPEHFHEYGALDVRAVRGPYTREWLKTKQGIDAPEVYGDPALLLPSLTKGRLKPAPSVDHVFVPNLNDMLNKVEFDLPDGTVMASPMQSWNRTIDQILKARFVSATSLHGVVIAEAYGIPARYVRLSETENMFKYNDYYAGTGRETFEFARSISEAVEMGGEAPIKFNEDALKAAFPYDLWR